MANGTSIKKMTGEDTVLTEEQIQAFERSLRGELILPHHSAYDSARKVWNGMIDKRPDMIVRCAGTADVIASVNLSREQGLLTAVRSGGHNVAGNDAERARSR